MRLRKVRVRNFRNFGDLTIDPFPTPAVIVGENGVGKTNLLQALRLVLDPDLSDRKRRLEPDDIHDRAAPLAAGVEVSVQLELTDFDDEVDARAELDGAIVATEPLVARLTYLFRPKISLGVVLGQEYSRPLTPQDYEWTVYGADDRSNAMITARQYASLSVLPALRDAENDLTRPDRSPLVRLLREMPPDEANIEKALKDMQSARDKLGEDANVNALRKLLRTRVTQMSSPQLNLDLSVAFAGRPEDMLRSLRLFIDPAGTRGIDRTSTGAANVIYLALLLEHLQLRRVASDGEDTLLAVEEPEAHLHPTLQRHLFAHLLGEPNRLVLTTHSPHIAAVTPLESIVLVSDDGPEARARSVPAGLLDQIQTSDIERYLNVTRAEMLFARFIVLVEGTAEIYLLPALARAAGFDLDRHGVVIASVDGTDFLPYARVLGRSALDRPFSVLTDGDPANDPLAPEQGLMRAASILEQEPGFDHASFLERLPPQGQKSYTPLTPESRNELVNLAAGHRIYVGPRTLESDLASLFSSELIAAFNEFAPGAERRSNFKQVVERIVSEGATDETEQGLISRIERIGKGRYAQRLADHLSAVDMRERVTNSIGVSTDTDLTDDLLAQVPGCGHLLVMLHDVRSAVEELPLLATAEQVSRRYPQLESPETDGS